MIIDLRKQQLRAGEPFDVCVIGAGAAGIAAAVELAAHGSRVVLLESGGRRFERRSQAQCAGDGEGFQGLYNGRCRMLGGTTALWGGQVLPIDRHVLAGRPGIGGRWPLNAEDLEPYYRRACVFEGLDPVEPDGEEIWRAMRLEPPRYGASFETAFSRWCPVREFDRLHADALQRDPHLTVCLHATLTGVRFHGDGRTLRAVQVAVAGRGTFELSARQFVLAVGGIETCRLLLQPQLSDGPAPWLRHGWVGRHFQDHIACTVGTLHGAHLRAGHFDYVAVEGLKYHPKIKLRPDVQQRHGLLDVCGTVAPTRAGIDDLHRAYETYRLWHTRQWRSLTPARVAHLARHAHLLLWQRVPVGRPRTTAGATLRLVVHCEQRPDGDGQVSLSRERDATGLLRARVDWRFATLEFRTIRTFVQLFDESLRATGQGAVQTDAGFDDDDVLGRACRESFHHLGGARMAARPEEGVVDAQLRVHGTGNLYLCSTAVFPSAGFANPTHTLIALALRLADHLRSAAVPAATLPAAAGTRRVATAPAGS